MEKKQETGINVHQQQGLSIPSEREKTIAKALVKVNQLLQYPLTVEDVFEWTHSIERIYPGMDVARLECLMDAFMTQQIPFDNSLGIRNIFTGLKRIQRTENGWQVIKHTW